MTAARAEPELPARGRLIAPSPPAWAIRLVEGSSDDFALVTIRGPRAVSTEGVALEALVEEAYVELLNQLSFPAVRIWNFLPRILEDGGDGQDRYMRFNAGRYRAFVQGFGGAECFDSSLPAGSAVGHAGPDLIIHALACRHESVAVGNPRQCPPHEYSLRFGPKPPCFARARLIHGNPQLLVIGGTASVRGEESVHTSDLGSQLTETVQNLSSLISAAFEGSPQPLAHLRNLRVYYVRTKDHPAIEAAIARWFSAVERVEWMQADLCRPDLLAEIEGLAQEA